MFGKIEEKQQDELRDSEAEELADTNSIVIKTVIREGRLKND